MHEASKNYVWVMELMLQGKGYNIAIRVSEVSCCSTEHYMEAKLQFSSNYIGKETLLH